MIARRSLQAIGTLILLAATATAALASEPVEGTPLYRDTVQDNTGRTITYYSNRPPRPAPILLMIQGSGCSSVMHTSGHASYSSMFDLLPLAAEGNFKVIAVEKPFADPSVRGGTAEKCSTSFRRDFTAESWLAALETVLAEVRKQPDVDPRRTIVLGVSEGAVMASMLAGHDRKVTHVISMSGSGTTQLFDFIALAYRNCFDRSTCLDKIEAQVRAINEDPQSATRLAWGHPFRRWSSFFRVDPGQELLRSKARIYIALGTADEAVPALSTEVAIAKLLANGKDVTIRRAPDAGHGLLRSESGDFSALDKEFRRALAWASTPAH